MPNPAPMAYGVVATSAQAVNALKQRRPQRHVATSLHDPSHRRQAAQVMDLPVAAQGAVVALRAASGGARAPAPAGAAPGMDEAGCPRRLRGGVRRVLGANGTTLEAVRCGVRQQCESHGQPPAATAAEAIAMLGSTCPVIDGDVVRGQLSSSQASTMIRVDRAGRLALHRSGAQDVASGLAPAEYLRELAASVGLPGNQIQE
ncbi:hypothetical protein [Microbacterium elymi]|uniref:Uncharacterized protein n=1 Tax=Microbacterium elymi TaxID=2909587 RepID=A0ABY5NIN3_9MICO|nr:hypothetical protein [Microbacterium elymi]UUT34996.1 hypothetical protein L2X98_32110 [Microbacterium elymi]